MMRLQLAQQEHNNRNSWCPALVQPPTFCDTWGEFLFLSPSGSSRIIGKNPPVTPIFSFYLFWISMSFFFFFVQKPKRFAFIFLLQQAAQSCFLLWKHPVIHSPQSSAQPAFRKQYSFLGPQQLPSVLTATKTSFNSTLAQNCWELSCTTSRYW